MAQVTYSPIQLYRSSTPAAVPSASNIAAGELAINLADEKLYFKNAAGVVKVLASSAAVGTVTSVAASGGTTGLTFSGSPITGSGTLTLGGTLTVANGGTGAASFAANYLLKGNGTSAVSASSIYDNGTNVGIGTPTPAHKLDVAGTLRASSDIIGAGTVVTGYGVSTGDTALELGGQRSGSGNSYIDLHATSGTDYEARIFRASGADGDFTITNTGAGNFNIYNLGAGAISFATNNTERFRIGPAGQLGIGGANYGTSGQVLVSQGSGSAPTWSNAAVGTVTSVSGTGTVNGLTLTGTVTSSGSLTLGGTLSGVSLTTQVTGTLPIANGGTGAADAAGARTALGATTAGSNLFTLTNPGAITFLRINADNSVSALNAADFRTATGAGTVTSVSGTGSANGLSLSGTVTGSGNITLSGSVTSVAANATIDGVTIGFRSIPRSTTSGTATTADVGKCIAVTAGLTIPSATFAAGDAISVYNDSASAVTITQGPSLTLRQAGTGNTGNRTLAARGLATIWFNSASEAIISGAGVS